MDAAEILAIGIDQPEILFKDRHGLKAQFKTFAMKWHPDRCKHPKAGAVLAHINALFQAAEAKTMAGVWSPPGEVEFSCTDGKLRKIRYRRRFKTDVGETFYSPTLVAFVVDNGFADLFNDAIRTISALSYADVPMKTEISKYMPSITKTFETKSGSMVLVIPKTPDVYCLADVFRSLGNKVPPAHVAWILNGVYNVACYLQWAKLCHGDISMESIFISPKYHSVMLYGGWWYAHKQDTKINALPARSHRLAPPDTLKTKIDDGRLDLFLTRALGREILGDPSGMKLSGMSVPKEMERFLRMPAGHSARLDYFHWGENLKASFGPRRFIELAVNESDIFTKE